MQSGTISKKIALWYNRMMYRRMIHGVTHAEWVELHNRVLDLGMALLGTSIPENTPPPEKAVYIYHNRAAIAERCLQSTARAKRFLKAIDETRL